MSETHTPGRLHAGAIESGAVYLWSEGETYIGEVSTDDVSAVECLSNAARLAAAWNACESVSTGNLHPGDMHELILDADDLRQQRDELRAALALALPTLEIVRDRIHDATHGDNPAAVALCERIRAALSRCT